VGAGFRTSLAEQLECSELVYYPTCPFPIPEGEDRQFLLQQRLVRGPHKNISYDPLSGKLNGYQYHGPGQSDRLGSLLAGFSANATAWLATVLPEYAASWTLDRATLRTEEEATRQLRLTARNDLLHVDAFPTRPTNGRRILRCFVNISPDEPRIWVTSEPFLRLLERYGQEAGLPSRRGGRSWRLQDFVLRIFRPGRARRSLYDAFMLRFHDFLKKNDRFQEKCAKRYWRFPPGSAWLVFTDAVSHAALRGRGALEQTWFVAPEALVRPDAAPAACLEKACGCPVLNAA
jgi:hypothetical protein